MAEVERHASADQFAATGPGNPGMHTTNTFDYGAVLAGDVQLRLDRAAEVLRIDSKATLKCRNKQGRKQDAA